MGLGGGKGRGGGKGGKGGKGLGGILGNVPIVGGMMNGIGSQLPIVGGMFNQGMGQMPGMMGASMGGMNPMMALLGGKFGNMFGMPMRGMGQPMFQNMQQMFDGQGRQGSSPFTGSIFSPPGQTSGGSSGQPGQGGIFNTTGVGQQPQGGGGNMPALGTPSPSGGGPGQFALPRSQGYSNTDYGLSPDRGPQRTFGGFTGSPMAGGNTQSQFFDPRVNR